MMTAFSKIFAAILLTSMALVHFAPTADMVGRDGVAKDIVPNYIEKVERAQAAVAGGAGGSHVIHTKYYLQGYDQELGIRSAVLMMADNFLEYWGPNSRAIHTDRVGEFDRPSLSITGTEDGLMNEDFINRFTSAHKGRADAIWYEGGSPGLRELQDGVLADVVKWTEETFAK